MLLICCGDTLSIKETMRAPCISFFFLHGFALDILYKKFCAWKSLRAICNELKTQQDDQDDDDDETNEKLE